MNAEAEAEINFACDAFLRGGRAEAYAASMRILARDPGQQQARHIVMACEHGMNGPVFTCLVLRDARFFDIGDFTYGVPSIISCRHGSRLTTGRYCAFAMPSTVHLGALHRIDWISGYGFAAPEFGTMFGPPAGVTEWSRSEGEVVIGNDVWVATGATILSGSRIGDGAVIAAGAHVGGDIEPYAIVAGNPGRVVGHRFSPEARDVLLRIRWWDWSHEKVRAHAAIINSGDIAALERVAG